MPDHYGKKSKVGKKRKKKSMVRSAKTPSGKVPKARVTLSAPNEVPMSEQVDVLESAKLNTIREMRSPELRGAKTGAGYLDTTADTIKSSIMFTDEFDYTQSPEENINRIMQKKFSTKSGTKKKKKSKVKKKK